MKVWRIMAHHEDPDENPDDKMYKWSKRVGRVAVAWGETGDLRKLPEVSREMIRDRLRKKCPGRKNNKTGVPSLWNFWNIEVGDLAIISRRKHGRSDVVKITGEYHWKNKRKPYEDYQHQREVVFTDYDADEIWKKAGGKEASDNLIRWTVVRCKKDIKNL